MDKQSNISQPNYITGCTNDAWKPVQRLRKNTQFSPVCQRLDEFKRVLRLSWLLNNFAFAFCFGAQIRSCGRGLDLVFAQSYLFFHILLCGLPTYLNWSRCYLAFKRHFRPCGHCTLCHLASQQFTEFFARGSFPGGNFAGNQCFVMLRVAANDRRS